MMSFQVCEGDTINVTVTNRLENGEGTSIHWHGIHQRNSPYMDGTGLVTQCPIDHGTTFTYTFKADSVGTQFWHAHVGLQRQDGLAGSLVVRQAAEVSMDALKQYRAYTGVVLCTKALRGEGEGSMDHIPVSIGDPHPSHNPHHDKLRQPFILHKKYTSLI